MAMSDEELIKVADERLDMYIKPGTKRSKILTTIIDASYEIIDN